MAAISIKSMLDAHFAATGKTWEHDRDLSVGASEVGQCLRKTWFAKTGVDPDPDYLDRYGAKLRGDLIETHHWEPGIRAQLPDGVALLFAGADQKTLVDGYLSATSDGLLVGLSPRTRCPTMASTTSAATAWWSSARASIPVSTSRRPRPSMSFRSTARWA